MSSNRVVGAVVALACCGLLAACAEAPPTAGGEPNINAGFEHKPASAASRRIVVQPGQSLGRIAESYHVSKQAIIAANHLAPPYSLKAGASLTIPGGAAAEPGGQAPKAAKPVAAARATLPHAEAATPARAASRPAASADVIPLDDPPSTASARPKSTKSGAAAANKVTQSSPPSASRKEIPLD